jgi:hypothetical protein
VLVKGNTIRDSQNSECYSVGSLEISNGCITNSLPSLVILSFSALQSKKAVPSIPVRLGSSLKYNRVSTRGVSQCPHNPGYGKIR